MTFTDYKTWGTCNRFFVHETVKFSANHNAAKDPTDQPTTANFKSKYMATLGDTQEFSAAQFHIHQPSEHTVDGRRMDMEIHFVHWAGGDAKPDLASALGLMFSVDNPDPITSDLKAKVDAFLDNIVTNVPVAGPADSAANDISFNDQVHNLITALDWDNRWGYSGSLTTPPCTTGVYHNVLKQILPVSLAQMNAVKTFTTTPTPAGNAVGFYD